MNYIVIEFQTNGNTTSVLTDTYSERNAAESKFHTVMGAAAISTVEVHACTMLAENGQLVRYECYKHPQPEPEEV